MTMEELKKLHEQGIWIEMPCKIGQMVYFLVAEDRLGTIYTTGKPTPRKVTKIIYDGKQYEIVSDRQNDDDYIIYGILGDTVFLTETEANKKLKDIRK